MHKTRLATGNRLDPGNSLFHNFSRSVGFGFTYRLIDQCDVKRAIWRRWNEVYLVLFSTGIRFLAGLQTSIWNFPEIQGP